MLLGEIVTAAFGQRRKTLRNTLRAFLVEVGLRALGIDPDCVASGLSLANSSQSPTTANAGPNENVRAGPAFRCGMLARSFSFFFIGQVFMPSSEYAGQRPEKAGGQRHDADPCPYRPAHQRPCDQRNAHHDTKNFVDTAYVSFATHSLGIASGVAPFDHLAAIGL